MIPDTLLKTGLQWRERGDELYAEHCPYCETNGAKTPFTHFSVNIKKGVFYCQKCQVKGALKKLLLVDFKKNPKPTLTRGHPPVSNPPLKGDFYKWYEKERGISVAILRKYKVTYYDRAGQRYFVYKYCNEHGKLVNQKYRSGDKKNIWTEKGKEQIYYGLQFVDFSKDFLYITEGEDDCHALAQIGIENVVSVPFGAKNYSPAMDKVNAQFKNLILIFDSDEAGQAGARLFAEKAGLYKCKNVILPLKDARDCLLKNVDLKSEITKALPFEGGMPAPIWGSHYNKHGIPDRKPALIEGVLRRSHKMLIGAPSKSYKSFLALSLGLSIATGSKWLGFSCKKGNVYVINFELDEASFMHRVDTVSTVMNTPIPDNILFHHLRGHAAPIEELLPYLSRQCEGQDFSAIILDPQYKMLLSSLLSNNISENDSSNMAYLYGEIDRHFSGKNISPIIVSHFAKGTAAFKDSIDRIAGSGLMARDTDALLTLSALDSQDSYRAEFTLRDFKPIPPISLRWDFPLHRIDKALDMVPLKTRSGRPGADTAVDDAAVLQVLRGLKGKATQSAVREALDGQMGLHRVLSSLQRLVDFGKARREIKGNNHAAFYDVI